MTIKREASAGSQRRNITVEIETKTTITLDIETAAKWFCGLSDDEQCRFFVSVTDEASKWDRGQDYQWWLVGSHIRNCECSSDAAREMIREMHNGLQRGTH